jgi:hypothetical protein
LVDHYLLPEIAKDFLVAFIFAPVSSARVESKTLVASNFETLTGKIEKKRGEKIDERESCKELT